MLTGAAIKVARFAIDVQRMKQKYIIPKHIVEHCRLRKDSKNIPSLYMPTMRRFLEFRTMNIVGQLVDSDKQESRQAYSAASPSILVKRA